MTLPVPCFPYCFPHYMPKTRLPPNAQPGFLDRLKAADTAALFSKYGGMTMKKIIPFLMALLLLAGCGAQSEESTYRQVNAEEADSMMEEESGYIILDVRTAQEYSEKHIPGAINIPNETIGTEDIPELPDKEQLILVYCRSGNRSKQASEKLVKLGYTNIVEFGGINDWTGETVSGEA